MQAVRAAAHRNRALPRIRPLARRLHFTSPEGSRDPNGRAACPAKGDDTMGVTHAPDDLAKKIFLLTGAGIVGFISVCLILV